MIHPQKANNMESAVNYIVESSICLGVFTLYYRMALKNNCEAWFNRLFLMSALFLSAVIPFLHFQVAPHSNATTGYVLPEVGINATYMLDAVTVVGNSPGQLIVDMLKQMPWFGVLYLTGFVFAVGKLLVALLKLRWFSHSFNVDDYQDIQVVDVKTEVAPFSFFKWMFINKHRYQPHELQMIIEHEQAHLKLYHSYDIVLLELILIFQWFNPFVWLMRRDLREVHEFQADRMTLQAGVNADHYKQLLVVEALGTNFDLGHSFSHSLIQKRLKMMNNSFRSATGIMKPVLSLAIMLVIGFVLGVDRAEASGNYLGLQELEASLITTQNADSVYEKSDVMPEYPGGMEALTKYFKGAIRYPKDAKLAKTEGIVFVRFVVTKTGDIEDINVVKSEIPDNKEKSTDESEKALLSLQIEAIRVVSGMLNWKPGTIQQKAVNVSMIIPINFSLTEQSENNASTTREPFIVVEQMPEFPGGRQALLNFLAENTKYPNSASENKKEGVCYLRFIIDSEGVVKRMAILKSSGNVELDQEALRVIKTMPKWQPGKQGGKTVNVSYTLPVSFKLK
jgi:TonB family protein